MLGEHRQYFLAVCKRGHIREHKLVTPEPRSPHCTECGAPVIVQCEGCDTPMHGSSSTAIMAVGAGAQPPAFCRHCGRAFPWASREQRVGQLYNQLDFQDLSEAQRLAAIEQIAVLSRPVDEVGEDEQAEAAGRLRDLAPNMWDVALPVISGVLSEAAKRQLGL